MKYFMPLLGLLFIGLKLTHYIDWSWWWVLAPIYGPVAVFLAIALVAGLIWLGLWLSMSEDERHRARAADLLERYGKALGGK